MQSQMLDVLLGAFEFLVAGFREILGALQLVIEPNFGSDIPIRTDQLATSVAVKKESSLCANDALDTVLPDDAELVLEIRVVGDAVIDRCQHALTVVGMQRSLPGVAGVRR